MADNAKQIVEEFCNLTFSKLNWELETTEPEQAQIDNAVVDKQQRRALFPACYSRRDALAILFIYQNFHILRDVYLQLEKRYKVTEEQMQAYVESLNRKVKVIQDYDNENARLRNTTKKLRGTPADLFEQQALEAEADKILETPPPKEIE